MLSNARQLSWQHNHSIVSCQRRMECGFQLGHCQKCELFQIALINMTFHTQRARKLETRGDHICKSKLLLLLQNIVYPIVKLLPQIESQFSSQSCTISSLMMVVWKCMSLAAHNDRSADARSVHGYHRIHGARWSFFRAI